MPEPPPSRDLSDDAGNGRRTSGDRQADAPHEIPRRAWRDVIVRVKDESRRDNLTLVAAGVAFYGLLATAPALAAVVALFGLVATPSDVHAILDRVSAVMPAEARQLLDEMLTQLVATSGSTKGISALVGVVIAVWSASAAMRHLIEALSSMEDEDEDEGRGFVALRVHALLLTAGAIAFVLVTMGLLAVVPPAIEAVGNEALATAVSMIRWPFLLVLMMLSLSVLYRLAPDRDEPRWRWVSWGAALATVVWLVASIGFSVYTSNFGNYSKTYGSMAAVIVTMVWLWITALCILFGAEVNAELERQTGRDSTRGPEPD
jgi:membrane protein